MVGSAGPANLGASNVQALKGLSTDGTDLYLAADFFGGAGDPRLIRVNITAGAGFGTVLSSQQLNGIGTLGNPAGLTEFVGVPEPSALLLSVIGLGLIGFGRSKRKS